MEGGRKREQLKECCNYPDPDPATKALTMPHGCAVNLSLTDTHTLTHTPPHTHTHTSSHHDYAQSCPVRVCPKQGTAQVHGSSGPPHTHTHTHTHTHVVC